MTKDDRQYFTKLFKGLEGRFDGLEDQVGRNYEAIQKNSELIQKNSELIQKNSDGIRHNGVLIEKMQSDIDLILEGNSSFHGRISRLEKVVL